MTRHFEREIEKLKRKLLTLSAIVEENVRRSVRAVLERDEDLARRVIEADVDIDVMEVDVEEECLKILALHQPVAGDLRFIIAVLKMNNDLERIADIAVNIAERARSLTRMERISVPIDLARMSELVQSMLRASLDALVNLDVKLAREVGASDSRVDAMNRRNFDTIQAEIRADLSRLDSLMQFLSVSRYLERIADHAGNIAEDVIYMVEGVIIRHKGGEIQVPVAEAPSPAAPSNG